MSFRSRRVSSEIHKILSSFAYSDTRFNKMVISYVSISNDLKNATVFFRLSKNCSDAEHYVKKIHGFAGIFRNALKNKIRLKYLPYLRFKWDDLLDEAERIDNILQNVIH